jgi:Tfp pilus assembly protein PilF
VSSQGRKEYPCAFFHTSDAPNSNLFLVRLQLDGGDAGTLVQYGSFLCDSCGDLAIAEDAFRRAAGAQPSMFDAVRNLGAVLEGRGADDEAKVMYKRALALSPTDEDVQRSIKRVEMGYESLLGAR